MKKSSSLAQTNPPFSEENFMRRKFIAVAVLAALCFVLILTRTMNNRAHAENMGAGAGASFSPAAPGKVRDRCGTRDLDETTATSIQNSLDAFTKGRGQGRGPGSITIPVYFHVVNKGSGVANGDV